MPEPIAAPQPVAPAAPAVDPTVAALQAQVTQLTGAVQNMGQFVEDSSYVLATIYQDPALKTAVQGKFNQNPPAPPAPPAPPPATATPPPPAPANVQPPAPSPGVQSMDIKMREDIIAGIESKYGYDKLAPDQRKILRRSVEEKMNAWGTSVVNAPVNQLPKTLEDAYLLTDIGKAKEEGRVQGVVEAYTNNMAAIPTMQGASPAPETTTLSADQQKWTKRWNLDEGKVTERLKEFQDTGVMTYKEPAAPGTVAPPAPSGSPTYTPPVAPAAPAPVAPVAPPVAPVAPPAVPVPQPQNAQ